MPAPGPRRRSAPRPAASAPAPWPLPPPATGRRRPTGCRRGLASDARGCTRCARAATGRCASCRLQIQGDARAVLPQSLERVVGPVLAVLDVHDDLTEVQQDPPGLASAFPAQPLGTGLEHGLLDGVGDRCDLTFV